jgi:hypothetical protein
MSIASETLRQLGGSGRLKAMIAAKDIFSGNNERTLMFKFKGSENANYVAITLNDLDYYDIQFQKIGRKQGTLQAWVTGEFRNIDAENLKSTIEEFTGLYLSI